MDETSSNDDVLVAKRLGQQVKVARDELKNIRYQLNALSKQHSKDACKLESFIKSATTFDYPALKFEDKEISQEKIAAPFEFQPIGYIRTCFKTKNGTPRQASLCPLGQGFLELDKSLFTNPEHCLDGILEFSHVWLVFVFHKNANLEKGKLFSKSKIHPPRLDGESVGIFATRSPYRPSPIGLSLTQIDRVEGGILYFSGLDLIDGTPVLDIKPYIPAYDKPSTSQPRPVATRENSYSFSSSFERRFDQPNHLTLEPATSKAFERSRSSKETQTKFVPTQETTTYPSQNCSTASWLSRKESEPQMSVCFTLRAQKDLVQFHPKSSHSVGQGCSLCLDLLGSVSEAKKLISDVLVNDPRSTYRRMKCSDKLYYFSIDRMHITCWFDDSCVPRVAEILRVQPETDFH